MAALAMILASILFPVPNRHITKENADRITGKSLREIEAILGGKAGDYRTGPNRSCYPGSVDVAFEGEPPTKLTWKGDEVRIAIWVDRRGTCRYLRYTLMCPERLGILRTLVWRCRHWGRANFSWVLPRDASSNPPAD